MSSGIGLNDASGAAISGRGRNYMGGRLAKPADRDHMIQTEVLNIENRKEFKQVGDWKIVNSTRTLDLIIILDSINGLK